MYNNRGNRDYLIRSTGRGGNGQSRRALDRGNQSKNIGSKKDDKIYKFVRFTRHSASTLHISNETMEAYIHDVFLKLSKFAQDIRQAILDEKLYVFTNPMALQARLTTVSYQFPKNQKVK